MSSSLQAKKIVSKVELLQVRLHILGNARIKTVGKSNPCMVTTAGQAAAPPPARALRLLPQQRRQQRRRQYGCVSILSLMRA